MIFSHQSSFSRVISLSHPQHLPNNQITHQQIIQKLDYNIQMLIEDIKIEQQSEQQKRQEFFIHNNKKIKVKSLINMQKIQLINQKQDKYKRATNNSHKKFINIAKKLYLSYLPRAQKIKFKKTYTPYNHSLKYFFITLTTAYFKLDPQQLRQFKTNFIQIMRKRIHISRQQTKIACNHNFINFRNDEINDIEFALQAFQLFYQGEILKAVTTLYKKDKNKILKKIDFDECLSIIRNIINQFSVSNNREILKQEENQDRNSYVNQKYPNNNNRESFQGLKQQQFQDENHHQNKYKIFNHYPILFLQTRFNHHLFDDYKKQKSQYREMSPRIKIQHNEGEDSSIDISPCGNLDQKYKNSAQKQ